MTSLNTNIERLECIIDNTYLKFIYVLLKNILIKKKKSKREEEYINNFIQKINKDVIKEEKNYLNLDYSIDNFDNIINFLRSQNLVYVGEILEYILLKIFVQVIKVKKDEYLNKYIYNNLAKIRENKTFITWFLQEKFEPKELNNLKEIIEQDKIDFFHNSPFCYLLYITNFEKYKLLKFSQQKYNKTIKYIYNDCIPKQKKLDEIYESIQNIKQNEGDKDISLNSIMNKYKKFSNNNKSNEVKVYIDIINNFLYSVFIYYKVKNSPSINYDKDEYDSQNKYLTRIPYSYDLNGAYIEGRYANTIISPIRTERRISNILLNKNNLREIGMYEFGKSIVFNDNINYIQMKESLINSYYFDYFILGMGIYDNKSITELNLSYNYLNGNSENNLRKIIYKFKGLKTLNLSYNKFKSGLSSFFIALKHMFKKNESKIENIVLNNCDLDDSSFNELGDLLKNKFCKLKKLYLIDNNMPRISNFLKQLKKNKILTHIYIGKNNIGSKDIDDINKIISNCQIQNLYIFRNNIYNFKDALRILYRTRIIKKDDNEKNINLIDKSNSILKNLDLSTNKILNKNINDIQLLTKITEETSLFMLDFSKILLGEYPKKFKENHKNQLYKTEVDNLGKKLSEKKMKYKELIIDLRKEEINMKRLNKQKFEYNKFNKKENIISKIIKDKKANFQLYLREIARKMIEDEGIEISEENEDKIITLTNYMILEKTKNNLAQMKKLKEFYNFIII